jgi:hypothetical protein
VELEISAGAGIEADLRTLYADAPQRAVTEHILALADQAGYGAALIDAAAQGRSEAAVITWPQFAHMVRAAARGLSRRGLREGDTAGIFVDDAVSHAVAVHAVRAAGAIAAPVRPAQSAADIAAQLKERRARLLITSAGLADLAIQAAERCWVRQVYAFGEAEGTTPFGSLLQTPRHGQLQANGTTSHNGHNGSNGRARGPAPIGHAGGPAPVGHFGGPAHVHAPDLPGLAPDGLRPDELGPDEFGPDGLGPDGLGPDGLGPDRAAPQLIRRPVPRLTRRDVVVAAPPCGDPDAYTSLLDLALASSATVVAAPLTQVTAAVGVYKGTAAIVPHGTDVPGLPAGRVLAIGRSLGARGHAAGAPAVNVLVAAIPLALRVSPTDDRGIPTAFRGGLRSPRLMARPRRGVWAASPLYGIGCHHPRDRGCSMAPPGSPPRAPGVPRRPQPPRRPPQPHPGQDRSGTDGTSVPP